MVEEGNWPPDAEATRRRAFCYYEEELARKNRAKGASPRPARAPSDAA